MKTLLVLAALVAVALAGPTFRAADADLDVKLEKRSPTLQTLHHLPSPVHVTPVHHTYVQPIIPHHLGIKKPLIVKKPYGHHVFRSEDEPLEIHSAESKESKNKCMKEMEAKCDDDISAKSAESNEETKIEDVDGNVSDTEVAQSLQMAKEAVDTLQRKLQLAEKNSKMTHWKHGVSEADGRMHENVETAKLALEHMQRNFGNLESMNVHARAFKNAEIHDVNLELKSEVERLAQWKDAIENIQKNVELVRNIEDSFQHNEHSDKAAALDQSNSLKHEMNDDHKQDSITSALTEEKSTGKSTMKMAQNMEKKSDGKSSWQAREHEQSSNFKNEMETSASTLSESKITHHNAHEQQSFRRETSQSEKSSVSEISSASNAKLTPDHGNMKTFKDNEGSMKLTEDKKITKEMEPISQPSLKSSENLELKPTDLKHENNLEHETIASIVDTTNLMKSAEHNQSEQLSKMENSAHKEHSSLKEHTSQKEVDMSSNLDHPRSSNFVQHSQDLHEINLHLDHPKGKESESLDHHELPSSIMHHKDAHEMMMKSSDQIPGQSQQTEVAVKPDHVTIGHQSEKLHHSSSHGAHGKSAEDGSLFAPLQMNAAFKESLVPTKSWKESQSARGAYGSGLSLGGSYGAGYGAGSGAVGVFPHARVGGCAIPLLLSCSPSVVAGSLAKSHSYAAPSYAASAYRGTETNSHSKRDITKISRPSKVKRTPTNKDLKQKTILIADKL